MNYRNILATILVLLTFSLWIWADVPEIVVGASISMITLVVQFYYRKKESD